MSLCCFGRPYDILVVMDDRATGNVDPYKPQQKSSSYLHGIALGALLFFYNASVINYYRTDAGQHEIYLVILTCS